MSQYQNIILAGTFDRLHVGHLQLIDKAIKVTEKISCFVTTDKFINTTNKPLKNLIQPYNIRLDNIKKHLPDQTNFYPLDNPFGPADKSTKFEAILATSETEKNVELINYKRQKHNLSPLAIVKVDLKKDQSGKPISSARIRLGKINRQGLVYSQALGRQTLVLPQESRAALKPPLGQVLKTIPQKDTDLIITVGDVAAQKFLEKKLKPHLLVFDCRVQRRPVACPVKKASQTINNPAGQISAELIVSLKKLFNQAFKINNYYLKIQGEEDLAVLPIILLSPLSTQVFYGQPDQGLVLVKVTEEKKAQALDLLKKFNQLN